MTRHHPKESTLAEFAFGALDEGRSLVVAAHLALCGKCREFVASLEEVGGQLLEQTEPAALSEGARARALSLIAEEAPPSADRLQGKPIVFDPKHDDFLGYGLGPWRWVSPGLHYRAVKVPGDKSRVFMLKAVPGLKIPAHSHTGTELTCVLSGAFIHEGGRYAVGDCDDADHDDGHSPVIDSDEECICLIAMEGQIRLTGLFGRLIQPFIRF